ncbi:AMP-binding protein [Peribacillus butanolivorans]|uniref:AMP-binding protein n=1 Tax=Peribacillus butanolivorans TaxID=421767 RepID=UPI0036DDEABE
MLKKTKYEEFFECLVSNAKENPDKVAIVSGNNKISYGKLLLLVGKIAEQIEKDYKENSIIVVEANKNIESIATILGVCLSGKTFIPVSNLMSQERIEDIINNSKGIFIPNLKISNNLYDNLETFNFDMNKKVQPNNDNFYTIYTSGTTGKPKGVLMTYEGAFNTIDQMISMLEIKSDDVFLNLAPLDFDLSIFDIFGSLKVGGKLVLVEKPQDIKSLIRIIDEEKVTIWNSVPTMLEMLTLYLSFNPIGSLQTLRLVLVSGDKTKIETARSAKEKLKNSKIISLGGATECGIWSTYFDFDLIDEKHEISFIPYGIALPKQKIFILNENLEEVSHGEVGELYISGDSLAKGYLNDKEKTDSTFITLPNFGHIRAYKTGDLMHSDHNGCLIFGGRTDRQVKINGFRVELDGIENKATKLLNCNTAVVMNKNRIILAIEDCNGKNVLSDLKSIFPDYMIPSEVVTIDNIPLTKNGKKDYKKIKDIISKDMIIN